MNSTTTLHDLAKLLRYNILTSTTAAGSGHPTSSLSAVELMTVLFFNGIYHYDLENPEYIFNDRFILSKGHAAPLLYSLYQAAGVVSHEELLTLRKFDSVLEGHPTPRFKYVDVASGSLGQGLSVGMGMALGVKIHIKNAKIEREPHVWVLLGDSEMAEGQVWEALELAAYYKLNNLTAIVDVNRLGQRGETMLGWDIEKYAKRAEAFGWSAVIVDDGHDVEKIQSAYKQALDSTDKPVIIVAKTVKGKGISFLENTDNWHGKCLPKEKLDVALSELGEVNSSIRGKIQEPEKISIDNKTTTEVKTEPKYAKDVLVATREAYGDALIEICKNNPEVTVLDGETSNSTFSETVKKTNPEQFFEMFIAEQNMVSASVGLSKLGFTPFISTFAAFFTRTFDQIRMASYSEANIKIVGSHAGVSIGQDGPSQMALEDISMMRSISNSIVIYPSDAVSAFKLFEQIFTQKGIVYVRTTREKTPILYNSNDEFKIGGSKTLFQSNDDTSVIFAAGITLHETVKAYQQLKKEGISVAVVDLYSIKPLDTDTIQRLSQKIKNVIVVEDHYASGGIGEAVKSVIKDDVNFIHLAVRKTPRSGTSQELMAYEEINAENIIRSARS